MKLPELPEEKPQNEKPKPKYETKVVVHKPRVTPPSTSSERKPVTLFGKRPSHEEKKVPAHPAPVPPADREPAAPPQAPTSSQVPPRQLPNGRGINPGLKLRAVEAAGKNVPPAAIPPSTEPEQKAKKTGVPGLTKRASARKSPANAEPLFDEEFFEVRPPQFRKSLRAARKLGGIISLIVNVILLGVVIGLMARLNALNTTLNNVLGGLYDNFVNMDNATISTTINVEDMPIPLDFTLPVVQSETYVTLTRSVTIHNAIVGVLSVPTTVTLPAGTALPVSLSMEVPVQTTVLVDLQVPVNINLAQSNPPGDGQVGLHDAFLGLQNTIGPFYCLFKPDLTNAAGGLVCQQGFYNYQQINP